MPATSTDTPDDRTPPRGALRRLWIWFSVAPIVWWLHEAVSYIGAYNTCRAGGTPRAISIPASVIALVLVGVATVALARGRRKYPHADMTGGPSVRAERAAFLALFGGVLAVLALTGVVYATAAAFVEPCR